MIDPNFFLGYPVAFGNICSVYPPKIKDVLNNRNYPVYKKLFFSSQEDIEDEYTELKLPVDEAPTPLGYLFQMAAADVRIKEIIIEGFEFFIKEPVTMLDDQQIVVVGDLSKELKTIKSVEQLRILKEDNYFEFQQLLRRSVGSKEIEPYDPNQLVELDEEHDKETKEKFKMGLNLNPLTIGELSQAAVSILIRYYQEKNKYEIDIQSLLAGADSKKIKPQNWIRNIEDL